MESLYDLYRNKNPQYFSDTVVTCKTELTKEVFRHEMDKLSNYRRQDLFENFATSLAFRFITPNIVPQTGPTGGGDGKTDSETHPVADKIAEKWYVADGGCKGTEKWAFAISCKEDWKGKIKKDVNEIVKLGRGFTKIFFLSNRQIKSVERKSVAADLTRDYDVEVIILDQEWFVSKVFEDGCTDIAVKELNLSQQYMEVKEIGSNDLKRQRRLAEVDEKIANNISEDCLDTEYVDLIIESAFLSRALECPPSEIRAKFIRAEEISKLYGTKQQLFNVIWQRGWTEFYWLKNPDNSFQCYQKLKTMVVEDVNVNRLESILSLYSALSSAKPFSLFKDDIDFEAEADFFFDLYCDLEHDKDHYSSFLFLKIFFLEKTILQKSNDKDTLCVLLPKLVNVIEEATSYIDITFDTLFAETELICQALPENEMFDDIIDNLSGLLSSKKLEIEAAKLQKDRGLQYLHKGLFVKAIRFLGQSVSLLFEEPTKTEFIKACCCLGDAYQEQDLLYASKVMYTKAVALLLYNIQTTQSPDRLLITILSKLCLLSIRSGQIVNFLMAFESMELFLKYSPSYQDDQYYKERGRNERRLAARFLSENVEKKHYSELPAILRRLGMTVPVDILFYKLGYPTHFSSSFKQHMYDCPGWEEKMRDFIYNPLFLYANVISDNKTRLESLIRGCRFIATFDSDRVLQIYSELLLAFMESFVSTTYPDEITITTSQIFFDVIRITEGKTEIIKGESTNEYIFKVNSGTINNKEAWDAYLSYLSLFCTQNTQSNNMRELLDIKQKKEKMFHRLYVMMYYEEDVKALYGDDYKNTIEKWTSPDDECYPFQGKEDHAAPFEKERGKQTAV